MNAEQLSSIAGVILSLIFSYVPKVNEWYAAREATEKRLIMAGLLLLVALGAFGLSCGNVVNVVECNKQGALGLVYAFIAALVANQAAYAISPKRA